MDHLEKAEKIREKTGVSYDDAKSALEACDYDVLDAIVYLEKLGKIKGPGTSSYTTTAAELSDDLTRAHEDYEKSCRKENFGEMMGRFGDWVSKVCTRGMEIKFHVRKDDKKVLSLPLLVLVVLMIFGFWFTIPMLIVGLFCGCKYDFEGMDDVTVNLNDLSNKASNVVDDIKTSVAAEKKDKKDDNE